MKKLQRLIDENRFLTVIVAAIIIAVIWVVVSVSIYVSDGTYLLDLSRPGYEPVREQVQQEESYSQSDFSADGPVDAAALTEFLELYKERTDDIDKYDDFDTDALDEVQLRIAP